MIGEFYNWRERERLKRKKEEEWNGAKGEEGGQREREVERGLGERRTEQGREVTHC